MGMDESQENWRIETLAVQGGWTPENGEPRVLPIVQSTTYKYDTAADIAALFDLEAEGHMYSRISNPTVCAFEDKVAAMEGGVGALAVSAGQTASSLAILNLAQAGDHIVASSSIYGGTYNLFRHTLPKLGIEVSFVDQESSEEEIGKAFQENTKAVFAESLGNPSLKVLNFEKMAKVAHDHGVPLIVDNTFPTPFLCNPFKLGADIIIHSSTKYIDGHATSVGGVIVDKGTFDWGNGKFPGLVEPDPSYHGLSYTEKFGAAAYIVKARVQYVRDLGCYMSPMNAFLSHKGLETLHLRMERHSSNALELAKFLKAHHEVSWVRYPGLEDDPEYNCCQKYLKAGSGVLTFGVKGGREASEAMMNRLKLAAIVVHVADVRTSVLHPASMTHRQLNEEEQITAGVKPELVRVSVGIENIDDIKADFDQALKG